MLVETGCDGVMVGRSACGNIWIFRQIAAYLKEGKISPDPSFGERADILMRHLDMLIQLKGNHTAIREMRRHAACYVKGFPGAADLRSRFNQAMEREDFCRILHVHDKGNIECLPC